MVIQYWASTRRTTSRCNWFHAAAATLVIVFCLDGTSICATRGGGASIVVTAFQRLHSLPTHHGLIRPNNHNNNKFSSISTTMTNTKRKTSKGSSSSSSSSSTTSLTTMSMAGVMSPLSSLSSASTTTMTTWIMSMIKLRGGKKAAPEIVASAVLNLSQEGYNLQVLAAYGVLTALVMNTAMRLYTSTKFPTSTKTSNNTNDILSNVFTLVTSICVITGAFTAVLFQLLGLYAKSALGMGNTSGYIAFQQATLHYWNLGFHCFLTTLGSFVISFVLSLYNKTCLTSTTNNDGQSNRMGQIVFGISIALTLWGTFHIKTVLNLATKYIFTSEFASKFT